MHRNFHFPHAHNCGTFRACNLFNVLPLKILLKFSNQLSNNNNNNIRDSVGSWWHFGVEQHKSKAAAAAAAAWQTRHCQLAWHPGCLPACLAVYSPAHSPVSLSRSVGLSVCGGCSAGATNKTMSTSRSRSLITKYLIIFSALNEKRDKAAKGTNEQ